MSSKTPSKRIERLKKKKKETQEKERTQKIKKRIEELKEEERKQIEEKVDERLKEKEKHLEKEIENITKAVDFAHKKEVDILIAPEAGGRKEAFMFRKAYRKRYPKEKPPKIIFPNMKNIKGSKEFKETFPKVAERLEKGEKPMILDECTHTGSEIKKAKDKIGYISKEEPLAGAISYDPANLSREEQKELWKEVDFKGSPLNSCPSNLFKRYGLTGSGRLQKKVREEGHWPSEEEVGEMYKKRKEVKDSFGTQRSSKTESKVGEISEDREHLQKTRLARKKLSKMIDKKVKPKKNR